MCFKHWYFRDVLSLLVVECRIVGGKTCRHFKNAQKVCKFLQIQVEHRIREMDFSGSPQILELKALPIFRLLLLRCSLIKKCIQIVEPVPCQQYSTILLLIQMEVRTLPIKKCTQIVENMPMIFNIVQSLLLIAY